MKMTVAQFKGLLQGTLISLGIGRDYPRYNEMLELLYGKNRDEWAESEFLKIVVADFFEDVFPAEEVSVRMVDREDSATFAVHLYKGRKHLIISGGISPAGDNTMLPPVVLYKAESVKTG